VVLAVGSRDSRRVLEGTEERELGLSRAQLSAVERSVAPPRASRGHCLQ
jgi:hypothetical protein